MEEELLFDNAYKNIDKFIRMYYKKDDYLKTRPDDYIKNYTNHLDEINEANNINEDTVLFLGDDIFQEYNLVDNLKSRFKMIKSSLYFDTSDGVFNRIDLLLEKFNPSSIVINIGLFDIGYYGRDANVVAINILSLTAKIHKFNPEIKISIVSILPISKGSLVSDSKKEAAINVTIFKTNINLNSLTAEKENIYFINAYSDFNFQGSLIVEYTDDGYTLNDKGYKKLSKLIQKHIG